jgi:hypothetical protein
MHHGSNSKKVSRCNILPAQRRDCLLLKHRKILSSEIRVKRERIINIFYKKEATLFLNILRLI